MLLKSHPDLVTECDSNGSEFAFWLETTEGAQGRGERLDEMDREGKGERLGRKPSHKPPARRRNCVPVITKKKEVKKVRICYYGS